MSAHDTPGTIPLQVLVDAAAALQMVKDLPVHEHIGRAQWRQVAYAGNALSTHVELLLRALPPMFSIVGLLLQQHGITLDSVSASNMRHVITKIDEAMNPVREALAALPIGWQPISTRPMDGTRYLAICGAGLIRLVRQADKHDRLPIGDPPDTIWPDLPTHWMPLPAPPHEQPLIPSA